MEPVSWTWRDEDDPHAFTPAVLMGCTRGVCAKTEVVKPKKRDRKVPTGITPEQFQALKNGSYWPEIMGASS
jgi:hypothetical protein